MQAFSKSLISVHASFCTLIKLITSIDSRMFDVSFHRRIFQIMTSFWKWHASFCKKWEGNAPDWITVEGWSAYVRIYSNVMTFHTAFIAFYVIIQSSTKKGLQIILYFKSIIILVFWTQKRRKKTKFLLNIYIYIGAADIKVFSSKVK